MGAFNLSMLRMRNALLMFSTVAVLLASACGRPAKDATIADVEQGIRSFIDAETAAGDGYFRIVDDTLDMALRLVRVHTEYLSVLGEGRYFACVDLADSTGDVYDVDFFLTGDAGAMEVTKMTLHKLNGKPFYTWAQQSDQTWSQVPISDASKSLLGVIEGEDRFTFEYAVQLPLTAGRLWVPRPQSDAFQDVSILSVDAPMPLLEVRDTVQGNLAFFGELDALADPDASAERTLTITCSVVRKEKSPYAGEVSLGDLTGSADLPIGGRFAEIVDSVAMRGDSPLMNARRLYDYVIDHVRYAKQGTYGTGNATFACDAKSGNCTEFHALFISLARTAGIPARFGIGASIPSARNDGGTDGYHCWAEFHADGKWWPVDISEADKYTALATYYFGHHPANRIELSRGRDLAFEPGPTDGPIPFFAYPVFEPADGAESMPLPARFRFDRQRPV